MAKVLPSKTLAQRIESIRQENPGLTIEAAYDRIKRDDPKLCAAFASEIGFSPATPEEHLVPIK